MAGEGLDASEEAELNRLLAAAAPATHGADCNNAPAPSAPPQQPVTMEVLRDGLVFDAVYGDGAWEVCTTAAEVDFTEQRADKWAASVSVVLRLQRRGCHAFLEMHEETGSGHAKDQPDEETATCLAQERAVERGLHRLAKLFGPSLPPAQIAQIAREASRRATASGVRSGNLCTRTN